MLLLVMQSGRDRGEVLVQKMPVFEILLLMLLAGIANDERMR
jgi:hypothetical protein